MTAPSCALSFGLLLLAGAQSGAGGVGFVLKTEAQWQGDPARPEPPPDAFQRAFPDGSAEWEVVTDGSSFRLTLRGRFTDLATGTVVLQPSGESRRYVLHPKKRTYEIRSVLSPDRESGVGIPVDVVAKATGAHMVVSGHRAQEVVVSYRISHGPSVPRRVPQPRVETRNWCVDALELPKAATRLINQRVRAYTLPAVVQQTLTQCPVALRSQWTHSSVPGHTIVTSVTSIRRVAVSPTLFRPPREYREVAPSGQSLDSLALQARHLRRSWQNCVNWRSQGDGDGRAGQFAGGAAIAGGVGREDRLAEWRRMLRGSIPQGRAVLQKVVRGRITFTPHKDGRGFDVTVATRFDKLEAPEWQQVRLVPPTDTAVSAPPGKQVG